MTTTQSISQVLNRLRAYLGTSENPPGSNSNFIVDWYNKNVDQIGNGAWCEMTDTWAMWTGGAKALKKPRAYTVFACRDAVSGTNGSSWHYGTAGMRAGDQVYYAWPDENGVVPKGNIDKVDHTGTVEKINGNGTFYVLEGNVGDQLRRMLRDGKFVVGYVRFDWARLSTQSNPPVPLPQLSYIKPKSTTDFVKKLQIVFKTGVDGKWGPKTDARARLLRNAARAHVGYPKNIVVPFSVRDVQIVTGSPADGIWGPNSQQHLALWVKQFQVAVGVTPDGQWGPKTDNAFFDIRSKSYNK